MGISHEYHSAHGRARRSRAGTGLRLAGVIAAILLLSLAVTAILENGTKESEQPQPATSSGMAENILAPLPMQGAAADSTAGESGETAADSGSAGSTADTGAAAVTLENFGPARQTAGGYTVKAQDSSTIRQPSCGQVDPELLMKGLALLYQMNAPQHHAGGGKKRNQNFRRARRPYPQRRERREDEAKAG